MIDPSGLLSSFVAALTAIAPFFVVVGIGWLAAKRGLFDESGLSGLNSFIFNIALPPLLFRAMASAPISGSDLSVLWYVALYGAPTLILYALAYGSGRAGFGLDAAPATLHAHLAVNGNAGFLGLALAPAVLGPEALVPMALALTFDILVVMTLTSVLLARASSVGGGAGGGALWRALMNPIPIAALGGAFWGLAEREGGMVTPEVVGDLLDLLGQAAAPAALFAVGATLAHKRSDRRIGEIGS
ncbi:MAG: AEC family transporter, partial [Pseudomonadota bacterium]